jgi:hypothetical protein
LWLAAWFLAFGTRFALRETRPGRKALREGVCRFRTDQSATEFLKPNVVAQRQMGERESPLTSPEKPQNRAELTHGVTKR